MSHKCKLAGMWDNPKWARPAIDATLASGVGLGALGLVAVSCRGNKAALGLSIVACVVLLSSMALFIVASLSRARTKPRHDPSSGTFAPKFEVSEAVQAERAAAGAAEAAAAADALVAEVEDAADIVQDSEQARRTERIDKWADAPKQARRFIVTRDGEAPHPASVARLRAPRGAFTDIAARVSASVHNPGGELGPVESFAVLKPYAPPDIDGGTTAEQRLEQRRRASALTPEQRAVSEDIARERALDRVMARTLDSSTDAPMFENPLLLPLDGIPKPMR